MTEVVTPAVAGVKRDKQRRNMLRLSRPLALVIADGVSFTVAITMGLLSAMLYRYLTLGTPRPPVFEDVSRILIVFGTALVILVFRSWSMGHYSQFRPFWPELEEVLKTVLIIAACDAFLLFAIGVQFSRLWFGFFLVTLLLIIPYGREKTKLYMISKGRWYLPTYIVGSGENATRTAEALQSDTSLGHEVLGFIEAHGCIKQSCSEVCGIHGLPKHNWDEFKLSSRWDSATLVFALDTADEMSNLQGIINSTIAKSEQVTIVPPRMQLPLYDAAVVGIFRHDTALLKIQNRLADPNARLIKRTADVVTGSVLLLLMAPWFLLLAWFISRDGGPIFYRHERIGKHNRPFHCLKFRTMAIESDALLQQHLNTDASAKQQWAEKRKITNDPRITRIGHYLRKTSVDELPQLLNVIKGEMSLVGPRPIVNDEKRHYGDDLEYYLNVTPGMTGLWQVSGRTDTSYEERVRLDVWYCRNWSLWNDIVVLMKTLKTVMQRHGAY